MPKRYERKCTPEARPLAHGSGRRAHGAGREKRGGWCCAATAGKSAVCATGLILAGGLGGFRLSGYGLAGDWSGGWGAIVQG
ncbi:hypothetical protein GCM10027168_44110 [Streptomyces capparidis]